MSRQSKDEPSGRPRRNALQTRNRLTVKGKEPGYQYRVVNDVDDRVENLQEQGYEICQKETVGADKRVDLASQMGSVPRISVGGNLKAVLMKQKDEYFKEDQAIKMAQLDEVERTMTKGKADYGVFNPNADPRRY